MLLIEKKAYIYALISSIIWGSFPAISRINLNHLNNYQVLFFTNIIAVCIFGLILLITGRAKKVIHAPLRTHIPPLLIGIPACLFYGLFYFSMKRTGTLEALAIVYTWPFLLIIANWLFYGEKMDVFKTVKIFLGYCGVALVISAGNGLAEISLSHWSGNLSAMVSVIFWVLFNSLASRRKSDAVADHFFIFLSMLALSGLFWLLSGGGIPCFSALGGLLWIGALNMSMAFYLWFYALKIGDRTKMAGIMFLNPVFALAWVFALLDEKITLYQVGGMLVIFAAILIPVKAGRVAKEEI